MSTLNREHLVRASALGLVVAMMGFCYATSTGRGLGGSEDSGNATVSVGARGVGTTPLRFTNAFDPTPPPAYDLGDACYGSVITRYLTAAGGVRPYSFIQTGLEPAIIGAQSSLTLFQSGYLVGSLVPGNPSPLYFQSTVSDSMGTTPNSVTGLFKLNLFVIGPTVFRFGTDRVNNGVVGQHYATKVDTLGGIKTVTYSVVPNSLTLNGASKGPNAGLEAIGLSLASDGTISGRPLEPGLVSFTARAIDSENRVASPKSGAAGENQEITFSIEENTTASTDFTTLACRAKSDLGKVGKDSISFSGIMNLSGNAFTALNGSRFEFRLGGASFVGFVNFKGKVVNQRGGPVVYADGSRMNAAVDPRNGKVRGTVSKVTLGKLLDGQNVSNRSTRRYAVQLNIAKAVVASDMLEFSTRKSGDKFTVDYKLGKLGQSLGGVFQVLSVKGSDKLTVSGRPGVAWATKFLAVPRFGVNANAGLDAVSSLRVRIGNQFSDLIQSKYLTSTRKGGIQLANRGRVGEVVDKFAYNPAKFTGSLVTQPLSSTATGIVQAGLSSSPVVNFTLGLDVQRTGTNPSFSGEAAKHVAPGQKSNRRFNNWVDKVNLR